MELEKAILIGKEMQKWRRGQKPYNGTTPRSHRPMPYDPKVYGEAVDTLINFAEETMKAHDFFALMNSGGFNVKPEIVKAE